MDMLYLSHDQVCSLQIPISTLLAHIEEGFVLKGEGLVELPPKPGIHPRPDSFFHAMPAYIGGNVDAAGMKWVASFPANHARGLPALSGLFILSDPETGVPLAVMDCAWITAWRTAAATAVTAKHLASGMPETLAIFGLGVQGRTNLVALKEVFPSLRRVFACDLDEERAALYREDMGHVLRDVVIHSARGAEEAVRESDMVLSCTAIREKPNRFLRREWLRENALAIALDYDAAFDADVFTEAAAFIADDRQQYLWTKEKGVYFHGYPASIMADMGEICARKALLPKGRRAALLMGIASHDVITAKLVYRTAQEKGIGHTLPL